MKIRKCLFAMSFCLLLSLYVSGLAQSNGTLRGTVTIGGAEKPAYNVRVTITQLRRSVETDEKGAYEFQNVLPGRTARGADDLIQRIQPEQRAVFQPPVVHQGVRAGDRARREAGLYDPVLLNRSWPHRDIRNGGFSRMRRIDADYLRQSVASA
jgi:hypothetical protein